MADLPREALARDAQKVLDSFPSGVAKVFFKFTCSDCGTRCMFQDANMLWERGVCSSCGKDQPVTEGGYAVEISAVHSQPVDPDHSHD